MLVTWNYRIIHHDKEKHTYFAVHEVFYDEHGKVTSWTTAPIDVSGETQQAIIKTIKQMLVDTNKFEVLLESQIETAVHDTV